VKPGNVKKTALEFVDFYSKEFMGGVREPTSVGQEGDHIIVWFDFELHGIPSSIMLSLAAYDDYAVSDDTKIKDMEIAEDSGQISFSILPFRASPWFKK
jgi:hypothetical protein